jgi:hypothetical protein
MNTIEIYLDDGRIFTRKMRSSGEVHALAEIIRVRGYSHWTGKLWEIYPAHRIRKITFVSRGPDHEPFDSFRGSAIRE